MGYQDREYFRARGYQWYWRPGGSICRTLIVVNVIVFVIQVLTAPGLAFNAGRSLGFFTDALVMDPVAVFEHGQIWRPFTAIFLHDPHGLGHLVINMLVLWFFGHDMEDLYGPKEFLWFYLAAGVISSLVWGLCAYWLEPIMQAEFLRGQNLPDHVREAFEGLALRHRTALGASGAVTAVMILCAWHYPYRTILLFFILPVPLWLIAVVYVFADFMVLYQGVPSGTGVAAHLAGAAFATAYYYFNWRLALLGQDVWLWVRRRRGPKLRIARPVSRREEREEDFNDRLDAVLAKLKDHGRENLTAEELDVLQKASERYRKRKG